MKFKKFDFESYPRDFNVEHKLIYDVFCSYFLNLYEGKDRQKYLDLLDKDQINQTIKWVEEYAIPFYEKFEEYEKCSRLKNVVLYMQNGEVN